MAVMKSLFGCRFGGSY